MWIVDDDGDMWNLKNYRSIRFIDNEIYLYPLKDSEGCDFFDLHSEDHEERLSRYYDLVHRLTGEWIGG